MLWWASITEAEDEVDMVVLCIVLNDGVPKERRLQGKATCSGRSTVRPTLQRRLRCCETYKTMRRMWTMWTSFFLFVVFKEPLDEG